MEDKIQQTLIFRSDLKVRKGKTCSQIAHASLAGILQLMSKTKSNDDSLINLNINYDKDSYLGQWLEGSFTKIVLGCENEEELLSLYKKASYLKLNTVLITDNGVTEFNGIKTNTCISIGPAPKSEIDKITSHLKPL